MSRCGVESKLIFTRLMQVECRNCSFTILSGCSSHFQSVKKIFYFKMPQIQKVQFKLCVFTPVTHLQIDLQDYTS